MHKQHAYMYKYYVNDVVLLSERKHLSSKFFALLHHQCRCGGTSASKVLLVPHKQYLDIRDNAVNGYSAVLEEAQAFHLCRDHAQQNTDN